MVVGQTGSQQLLKNRPEDEVEGDGKSARKDTGKGLQYQRSVLMDRKSQLHKRLMRESNIIAMAKENLGQLSDVFKLLTEVQQQHCKLLSGGTTY